jgi:hypothetical protein
VADAHGNIDAFIDQVDDPVEKIGRHFDGRIRPQELHDARHDVCAAEQHRRGDRQVARGRGIDARDRLIGLGDAGEDVARVVQVAASGFGQAHAAGRALQQLHAQLRFERGNGPGDCRRGQVEAPGGGRKAGFFADCEEDVHQMELVQKPSACLWPRTQRPRTAGSII